MPYPVNPYYSGLYQEQQPNFLSWLYPLRINQVPASRSSVSDVIATKTPESKQQQTITSCGAGPLSPPRPPLLRSPPGITPPVVSIVGGTEANPNSWPFMVSNTFGRDRCVSYKSLNDIKKGHYYIINKMIL
jgi:hypothetical protein